MVTRGRTLPNSWHPSSLTSSGDDHGYVRSRVGTSSVPFGTSVHFDVEPPQKPRKDGFVVKASSVTSRSRDRGYTSRVVVDLPHLPRRGGFLIKGSFLTCRNRDRFPRPVSTLTLSVYFTETIPWQKNFPIPVEVESKDPRPTSWVTLPIYIVETVP